MAITVEEIWKGLLVRSGRFILEPSNVKLDQQKLVVLVQDALRLFSKYCPCVEHFNLTMEGSGASAWYTFTDQFAANGKTLGIPYMITDVVPIRYFGTVPVNFNMMQIAKTWYENYSLDSTAFIEKSAFPVAYRTPILYVPISGDYEIQATFIPRVVKKVYESGDKEGQPYWELAEVNEYDPTWHNFFELLDGLFWQSLGRSQRAFTIEDLPIRTDADTLVSEGIQKEEQVTQAIIDNDHAWYLAWT